MRNKLEGSGGEVGVRCMASATAIMRIFLRNRARYLLAPSTLRKSAVLAAALCALYLCHSLLREASSAGEALEREALLRLNAVWADQPEPDELRLSHGDHLILDALRKNMASPAGGDTVAKQANVLPRVLLL